MTVNFKTPGTKEFKKMTYLKEALIDEDPAIRKQALLLYNKITSTEYDKIIQELEEEIEKREKVFRSVERRKLKEARIVEETGQEVDLKKFPDKEDKNVTQEIASLNFKLKYYTELKDYEINSRLNKTKIKF
jgi:hypothetical protein